MIFFPPRVPPPVAAPDLLDPKSAAHNSKPRLSFSTKPVVLTPPEDDESDTRTTVMRWKTVSAIFFLVVLYLIIGATVFSTLEQPHESSQKLAILAEKLDFLAMHACVNSSELEALVKVGGNVSVQLCLELPLPPPYGSSHYPPLFLVTDKGHKRTGGGVAEGDDAPQKAQAEVVQQSRNSFFFPVSGKKSPGGPSEGIM